MFYVECQCEPMFLRKSRQRTVFKVLMEVLPGEVLFFFCKGVCFWHLWSSNLPYIGPAKEYRPPIFADIFRDNGEVMGRRREESEKGSDLRQDAAPLSLRRR